MQYLGKTTNDLTEKEFSELSDLFNHVFHKDISSAFLKRKYSSPLFEFSYHGLMYNDNGTIVGALTFIPFLYQFFDVKVIAGLAVDLMVHEHYRKDLLSVRQMHDMAIRRSGNSLDFVFAVPNSNSFLYYTKILRWREIGRLNYYIQVLNISALKRKLSALNLASGSVSFFLNFLQANFGGNIRDQKQPVSKVCDELYMTYRYNKRYNEIIRDSNTAYYSIEDESGINTAYVIDLFPLTKKWLGNVVNLIHKREKKNIDVIIYIGNAINNPVNLIKVPRKLEPRGLTLIANNLSNKVDSRIYDIANWHFNLADLDVR
jgi:hypothetical protein